MKNARSETLRQKKRGSKSEKALGRRRIKRAEEKKIICPIPVRYEPFVRPGRGFALNQRRHRRFSEGEHVYLEDTNVFAAIYSH